MNTCAARFPAGPAVAWARSNVNSGGRDSYPVELEPVKEKEKGYVDLLVSASLLLASKDFLPEVQNHGAKMLQHILKFRREEFNSFDCSSLIHQDDTDMTNMSNKFDDIIHPRMRCTNGTVPCHQVKGSLLLAEHNILCEAFDVVTSCLRTEQDKGALHCLLKPLNKIWIQSEWRSTFLHCAFGLTCLFSDLFLEMVYKVVKFCENELRQSTIESIKMQFCDLCTLLRLMLPFLLQLLQCIHSLWRGQFSGSLSDQLKSAKSMMSDEDFQENKTRKLLEEIRVSGYNIIGLSLSIEGVFSDLLDISSFSVAIFEDLGSMEFRHLSKLIHLVFVPLVTYCPCKFWKELRLKLLRPLLDHCEDLLYYAWFSLMHHGRAEVAYYFGKLSGSAENIEKFEDALLLEFTREVSHLLGVLSSPESNNGLLHYLLTHDCLGSLRMSLFGYWVDGEATTSAISFCLALVRHAGGTNNERGKLFVADELLPSVIRRLDDQLPCAMRNLIFKFNSCTNDTVDRDLIVLCKEIYIYISSDLCPQSQDLIGGEKGNGDVENNFTCWLAKQKEDLRARAFCAAPVEFNGQWNWEFEDEFQRYLPVYFNMLQEVDAMDDCAEGDCSDRNALLQKLNPQFRSKYAINSSEDPYLREISRMQKSDITILSKLITLKPYIKGSDRSYSVVERLEKNSEIQSIFDFFEVADSVDVLLCHVLYFWEPRFHPLIREEHKDLLLQIVGQLINAEENKHFQPLTPDPGDFALHLKPYARFYIETKLKMSMYARAALQINLHEDYDNYLASGQLDSYIYSHVSENFSGEDVENNAVPQKFSVLDHDLIQLSLKRRAQIVHMQHEVCTYSKCLRDLLENESLKDRLMSLMSELNAEGFFDIDSNTVNWDNECFSKLVEKFKNEVFTGHSLPRRYTIQGIVDYWAILQQKDSTWETFEKVVTRTSDKLIAYLPEFWRDTQYYKHEYYDIVREPLKKDFRFIGTGLKTEYHKAMRSISPTVI